MTVPISKLRKQVASQHDESRELGEKRPSEQHEGLRPLSRSEIHLRIESLTEDVASALRVETVLPGEAVAPRPRWVAAKDFVERMRPFLVFN